MLTVEAMADKDTMVTLVHGTWATHAAWTQEESELWRALKSKGYRVERVSWSGWNRYTARARGSAVLGKHLDDHQDVHHVVIAHSHGGNVAVRALDGDVRAIKGVICLNTPFFSVLSRDAGIFENIAMWAAIAASLIPLGLGIRDGFSWWFVPMYLGIAVAAGILSAVLSAISQRLRNRGQKYRGEPIRRTPFYCLGTPDDEAFGILAFLTATQSFLYLTICRQAVASRVTGVVVGGLLLFEFLPFLYLPWDLWSGGGMTTRALITALTASANPDSGWSPLLVLAQAGGLYLVSLVYYMALYTLAVLVALMGLSVVVTLSQGFFAPLSGLFARFEVTLTPLQSTGARFDELEGDATPLRHSSLYNDQATIDKILRWIESL